MLDCIVDCIAADTNYLNLFEHIFTYSRIIKKQSHDMRTTKCKIVFSKIDINPLRPSGNKKVTLTKKMYTPFSCRFV